LLTKLEFKTIGLTTKQPYVSGQATISEKFNGFQAVLVGPGGTVVKIAFLLLIKLHLMYTQWYNCRLFVSRELFFPFRNLCKLPIA
jgi:hypothetical protein